MNAYTKVNSQGYPILKMFGDLNHKDTVLVIFQRPSCKGHEYNWGWGYDVETGSWGQGHYDYATQEDAEAELRERYPDIIEIIDYDSKTGYVVDKENLSITAKISIAQQLIDATNNYQDEIANLGNECAYTDRILERVKYLANLLTDQPTVG